jgi:hypothetical protein
MYQTVTETSPPQAPAPAPAAFDAQARSIRNPQLDALVLRKYRPLLEDSWVRRWYYDKCRKSTKTGKTYMKTLGRVMNALSQSPSSFVALEQDQREGQLIDYLDWMSEAGGPDGKGCSDKYVETTENILKSWMAWRRVPMTRKTNRIRTGRSRSSTTPIPTRDDARLYMRTASLRAKFLASCTMYSAMRPVVLSNQDRREGLRFKDLPEVHIRGKKVEFDAIPTLVKVPWYLSKTKKPYPTFWCRETCHYFQALVEQRLRQGEQITGESLVFPPVENSTTGYLGELQLHMLVREAMDAAGLTASAPYTWKSYCLDGMSLSARDGEGLSKDDRFLLVGHECGVHYNYIYGKEDLTAETKERLRRAYEHAATKYLEAFPDVKDQDARLLQATLYFQLLGYTDDQVAAMDLASRTDAELVALTKAALRPAALAEAAAAQPPPPAPAAQARPTSPVQPPAVAALTRPTTAPAPEPTVPMPPAAAAPAAPGQPAAPAGRPRQRLALWAELDALLTEGWTFVREIPDGRILVAA